MHVDLYDKEKFVGLAVAELDAIYTAHGLNLGSLSSRTKVRELKIPPFGRNDR